MRIGIKRAASRYKFYVNLGKYQYSLNLSFLTCNTFIHLFNHSISIHFLRAWYYAGFLGYNGEQKEHVTYSHNAYSLEGRNKD